VQDFTSFSLIIFRRGGGDAPTNPFKYISPKGAMIIEQVSKFPAGFLLAHLAKGNMSFCHHLASVVR
jgi:hypothetical protein